MLKRPFRLRSKDDFKRVYIKGKTLNTRFFRVKTVQNELTYSRVGVVLSNKVVKKAAKRNRKKRQIRAAMDSLFPQLKTGYDIVVIAQHDAADAAFATLLADLHHGFERIGFITTE